MSTDVKIVIIAAGVYLYILFLGWGFTRLCLRDHRAPFQFWLAPWFGLMLAALLAFWLSCFGLDAQRIVFFLSILGAALMFACVLSGTPLHARLYRFDLWLAAGALVTGTLALYPMFFLGNLPTTMSLGNNDPATYCLVSDFLQTNAIAHLPKIDAAYPATAVINEYLRPGHRPGTYLLLAIYAALFHSPTYRIFSIVLAVFLMLTTPLVAVLTRLLTRNRFASAISLALTAANINFLYCYYHGFATQILVQGCIIVGFVLLLLSDARSARFLHAGLLGFVVVGQILIAPEGAFFFAVPLAIYIALQIHSSTHSFRDLGYRYSAAAAVVLIVGLRPLKAAIFYLKGMQSLSYGWNLPRWALPIDALGLMNVSWTSTRMQALALILSIPTVLVMAIGVGRWKNRPLCLALVVFGVGFPIYYGVLRQYSYGYYKAIVVADFIYIAAFAAGTTVLQKRYFSAVVTGVFALVLAVCLPVSATMKRTTLSVTDELAGTGSISSLDKSEVEPVSLDALSFWDRVWFLYFLPNVRAKPFDPGDPRITELARSELLRNVDESFDTVSTNPQPVNDVLWQNPTYELIRSSSPLRIGYGRGWNPREADARQIGQDAEVVIESVMPGPVLAHVSIQFLAPAQPTRVQMSYGAQRQRWLVDASARSGSFCGEIEPGRSIVAIHTDGSALKQLSDGRIVGLSVRKLVLSYGAAASLRCSGSLVK